MWPDRSDRINHNGPDLLWSQVADDLREQIRSGELPSGSKLPNEWELSEAYQVARVTVRRAIIELRKEKLVTVTIGRGTFVA
ncbi:MAG: GntR family transcriptional regulator [Pseudonocardiaceae bacterium]|nr:GntR family transcriptional regulator [Pseudonocardiaceae bacterium]